MGNMCFPLCSGGETESAVLLVPHLVISRVQRTQSEAVSLRMEALLQALKGTKHLFCVILKCEHKNVPASRQGLRARLKSTGRTCSV